MKRAVILLPCLAALALPASAQAQPLGTFRWQLRPYCNVVTVTVTQIGGQYRLEGTDDQCGAGRDLASVLGMAFPNPDGSIGFGMTIVTAPGGVPVHVDAEIAIATLGGTWRDSAGGAGAFVFTPGAGVAGAPRPTPTPVVPVAVQLSPTGSIVAKGVSGQGTVPASGSGVRMMWYPGRAAFRAGAVGGDQWNEQNIGHGSIGLGLDTLAVGLGSTAMGTSTVASGGAATAIGFFTLASNDFATAMGMSTEATGAYSTAMGYDTLASGSRSTAVGSETRALGRSSFAGGSGSEAGGETALSFGQASFASGRGSIALGTGAVAAGNGSFAFADTSSGTQFAALGPNQFNVRAAGGFQFITNAAATLGAALAPNATQWSVLSDVHSKHAFRALDGEDVLARIGGMSITEWSYKAQDASIRHIGPTAQDFHAAFGLGEDPLRIGTLDADGVAMAGVQALEARTTALKTTVDDLRRENADLRARLARLETLLEGK